MRYKAEVMFDADRDEEDMALWLEDVLYAASDKRAVVVDLSVYEVTHMPGWGYAD